MSAATNCTQWIALPKTTLTASGSAALTSEGRATRPAPTAPTNVLRVQSMSSSPEMPEFFPALFCQDCMDLFADVVLLLQRHVVADLEIERDLRRPAQDDDPVPDLQ